MIPGVAHLPSFLVTPLTDLFVFPTPRNLPFFFLMPDVGPRRRGGGGAMGIAGIDLCIMTTAENEIYVCKSAVPRKGR